MAEEKKGAPRYVNTVTGERVEASTPLPMAEGWGALKDEESLALLKEQLVPEVADLLGTMEPNEVMAVHAFATCLKVGGVSPAFFTLIADAIRDGGERIHVPEARTSAAEGAELIQRAMKQAFEHGISEADFRQALALLKVTATPERDGTIRDYFAIRR